MELNLRTFLAHQNLLVSSRPVSLPAKNLGSNSKEIPATNPVAGAMVSGLRDDALETPLETQWVGKEMCCPPSGWEFRAGFLVSSGAWEGQVGLEAFAELSTLLVPPPALRWEFVVKIENYFALLHSSKFNLRWVAFDFLKRKREIICQMPDPPTCLSCVPDVFSRTRGPWQLSLPSVSLTLDPGPRNPFPGLGLQVGGHENRCLCFRSWGGLGNRERAWSPQKPRAETSDHSLIKKKDRMCQIDFQATHTISAPLWNGAAKAPQTYTPLREPLLYAKYYVWCSTDIISVNPQTASWSTFNYFLY